MSDEQTEEKRRMSNQTGWAVIVELKCPKCSTIQEFVSMDFEDMVVCGDCGYSNEAWFFPHRPAGTSGPYVKGDVYSSDSLMYPKQFNAQYQALVKRQSRQRTRSEGGEET